MLAIAALRVSVPTKLRPLRSHEVCHCAAPSRPRPRALAVISRHMAIYAHGHPSAELAARCRCAESIDGLRSAQTAAAGPLAAGLRPLLRGTRAPGGASACGGDAERVILDAAGGPDGG